MLHTGDEVLHLLALQKWSHRDAAGFVLQRLKIDEEDNEMIERHPADELLQRQKADGTESYILGGY